MTYKECLSFIYDNGNASNDIIMSKMSTMSKADRHDLIDFLQKFVMAVDKFKKETAVKDSCSQE